MLIGHKNINLSEAMHEGVNEWPSWGYRRRITGYQFFGKSRRETDFVLTFDGA